jgi:hydrogenase nickel incorporation protein HypA/HybF
VHELSIALRIVEALEEELATHPAVSSPAGSGEMTVVAVAIQVGTLTGLVPEALQFSWEVATHESILRGSRLDIEVVNVAGICPTCGEERELTNLMSFRCPVCRTPITQITGGNEMEILTVEIEDG